MPKITKKVLKKTESESGNVFYKMENQTECLPDTITLKYSSYRNGYVLGDLFVPLDEAINAGAFNSPEDITRG